MWAPAAQFGRDPRPGTKLTQPGPPAPPTPRKETPTQDGVCSVIFTCTHAGAQGTAKELASEELDHAGRLPSCSKWGPKQHHEGGGGSGEGDPRLWGVLPKLRGVHRLSRPSPPAIVPFSQPGHSARREAACQRAVSLLLISPEPSPEGYHLLRVKPVGVAVSRYAAVRRSLHRGGQLEVLIGGAQRTERYL
ncbi:unnamed protein product [Gadus morhua 'NCC']